MTPKPLFWIGSSLDDLRGFPVAVREEMGFALHLAQSGGKHVNAKPLRGFGGGSIVEVVSDHAGDTFRAIYTVRFAGAVYVLHAFQKKSRRKIKTPKGVLTLIRRRLTAAQTHYSLWSKGHGT